MTPFDPQREPRTLVEVLHRWPDDQRAYHFEHLDITWGQLRRNAASFAAQLRQTIPEPKGAHLVLALPNGHEFFAAFYGCLWVGAVAVPIHHHSGAERMLRIARLTGAHAAVIPILPDKRQRGVIDSTRKAGVLPLIEAGGVPVDPSPAQAAINPEDPAFIQYTSGSTGNPKGIVMSHDNLLTNVGQMIEAMAITPSDVFVSWLPVYHDMGLILMTMAPFYVGADLILLPANLNHPTRWLKAIQDHRGTFTGGPDFAYRMCLRYVKPDQNFDLSSLRQALSSAEPVRATTIRAFEQRFGIANIISPAYGLAEATVGVSCCPPGLPLKVDRRGFVGVGRPFTGIQIRIEDDEGRPCRPGQIGEILIDSPALTRGYLQNESATRAIFTPDGLLRSGDLGYLDGEGDLVWVARKKNLIIAAGENISPREIEECVDTLPFVRRCAAVGIDCGKIEGEQPYVFLELRSGLARSGLARSGLARSGRAPERYRDLVIEATSRIHERMGIRPARTYLLRPRSIPFTSNGKLQHQQLVRDYLQGKLVDRILFPDY